MAQPSQQTIAIYILTNIPNRKGNQTMKLGQLLEYNMRNIFLEKSCTKCGRETIPRTFKDIHQCIHRGFGTGQPV